MTIRKGIRKGTNLDKILGVIYKKVRYEDYDEVLVLMGDEGTGKSRLLLAILEWWNSQEDNKPCADDVRVSVGMDSPEFSGLLRDAKKYMMIANDEAADISSRSAMAKQNRLFMVVYQLIRGENLFTVLVIPSIFDLDSFFRKRRVRHLIHIPKRGLYHFWDKQSLRRMVELNEGRPFKNIYAVRPTASGRFSDYKGLYLEPYLAKKRDKMQQVREMLADELGVDETFNREEALKSGEAALVQKKIAFATQEFILKQKLRGITE